MSWAVEQDAPVQLSSTETPVTTQTPATWGLDRIDQGPNRAELNGTYTYANTAPA